MQDRAKVRLTEVQETLLVTLQAKALDYRSRNSILHDEKASELIDRIDYDFGKIRNLGNGNFIVVRAKQYDEWLRGFLRANATAVVLNLGCGLDTRVTRINPVGVRWFDIDYPDVIRLRETFYANLDGYRMVGASLTDPRWLTEIPGDQPTFVVAEGVLPYLTAEEVRVLLNRMTEHFFHGQIAFDVMNALAIQFAQSDRNRPTDRLHKWAVENLEEVDRLDPRLKRMDSVSLYGSLYIRELPWRFRLAYGLLSLVPQYRNTIRLLRYQF